VLQHRYSLPHIAIEFPMMKWAEIENDFMVFNVGSLFKVGSCRVLCFGIICVIKT